MKESNKHLWKVAFPVTLKTLLLSNVCNSLHNSRYIRLLFYLKMQVQVAPIRRELFHLPLCANVEFHIYPSEKGREGSMHTIQAHT